MKFSIFSDFHYGPRYTTSSWEQMETIVKRAVDEGCEFIVNGGDLTYGPAAEITGDFMEKYNKIPLPVYNLLGNHDSDQTSFDETVKLYNMPHNYYYVDCKGYRFIMCDPNYYLVDGEYIHYDLGNYYPVPGSLRGIMPPDQLDWLKETIDTAEGPCILISHESFEREADGIHNLEDVRRIINDANKKKPHSVILCINGHHHIDYLRILDNVIYLDLNSATFNTVSRKHDFFPKELCEKHKSICNLVMFNDPLNAVIELDGTTVDIRGVKSTYFMGVSPELVGNPIFDGSGRKQMPQVQSAKIVLE